MTIIDAINKTDTLKPNGYTQSEKVAWLSTLDGMIKRTLLDNYEGDEIPFGGYNDDTPLTTQLLVEEPYSELYVFWLEGKIDYANGELDKYNNSALRFNDTYSEFRNYYNHTHMPKGSGIRYF